MKQNTFNPKKVAYQNLRKTITSVVLTAFFCTSLHNPSYAQSVSGNMPWMPKPGVIVRLSPEFKPAHLLGMTIHGDNALKFDFIVHRGDNPLTEDQKKEEYNKLIKYFLASLTIPDENQWVNLSPYEKNRIIKEDFGTTEMGRDLLAQDYVLKQITSSLIYPEDNLGKKFWDKVYDRAWKEYGTTNVPVNTFNKVWIIPDEAVVYESGNTAYVLRNHLKVMLEEDYVSLDKHSGITNNKPTVSNTNKAHSLASQIIKDIVLPELEREVNEGQNFANLRQIYSGMILATWYKKALKESLLGQIYVNRSKVKGVEQNPQNNQVIYQQYLKAFKKGVFNYIKEDVDKYTKESIPRKYFSGGTINDYAQVTKFLKKGDSLPENIDFASLATGIADLATVVIDGSGNNASFNGRDSVVEVLRLLQGGGLSNAERNGWQALGRLAGTEALEVKRRIMDAELIVYDREGRAIRRTFFNGNSLIDQVQILFKEGQQVLFLDESSEVSSSSQMVAVPSVRGNSKGIILSETSRAPEIARKLGALFSSLIYITETKPTITYLGLYPSLDRGSKDFQKGPNAIDKNNKDKTTSAYKLNGFTTLPVVLSQSMNERVLERSIGTFSNRKRGMVGVAVESFEKIPNGLLALSNERFYLVSIYVQVPSSIPHVDTGRNSAITVNFYMTKSELDQFTSLIQQSPEALIYAFQENSDVNLSNIFKGMMGDALKEGIGFYGPTNLGQYPLEGLISSDELRSIISADAALIAGKDKALLEKVFLGTLQMLSKSGLLGDEVARERVYERLFPHLKPLRGMISTALTNKPTIESVQEIPEFVAAVNNLFTPEQVARDFTSFSKDARDISNLKQVFINDFNQFLRLIKNFSETRVVLSANKIILSDVLSDLYDLSNKIIQNKTSVVELQKAVEALLLKQPEAARPSLREILLKEVKRMHSQLKLKEVVLEKSNQVLADLKARGVIGELDAVNAREKLINLRVLVEQNPKVGAIAQIGELKNRIAALFNGDGNVLPGVSKAEIAALRTFLEEDLSSYLELITAFSKTREALKGDPDSWDAIIFDLYAIDRHDLERIFAKVLSKVPEIIKLIGTPNQEAGREALTADLNAIKDNAMSSINRVNTPGVNRFGDSIVPPVERSSNTGAYERGTLPQDQRGAFRLPSQQEDPQPLPRQEDSTTITLSQGATFNIFPDEAKFNRLVISNSSDSKIIEFTLGEIQNLKEGNYNGFTVTRNEGELPKVGEITAPWKLQEMSRRSVTITATRDLRITTFTNPAMLNSTSDKQDKLGGIDLNSANLNLQIKRDGKGVPLPLNQQDMAQLMQIQGFIPKIIEITPAAGLPIFSELKQKLKPASSLS